MKKYNTHNPLFYFPLLFAILLVFSSACHRNKDCDLVITVQDVTNNAPVVGATVKVHPSQPPPTNSTNLADQTQEGTTDASGVVKFTFKLPAILQADVTATGYSSTNRLVKTEEGSSTSFSIKI